jgi:hypothetical protein
MLCRASVECGKYIAFGGNSIDSFYIFFSYMLYVKTNQYISVEQLRDNAAFELDKCAPTKELKYSKYGCYHDYLYNMMLSELGIDVGDCGVDDDFSIIYAYIEDLRTIAPASESVKNVLCIVYGFNIYQLDAQGLEIKAYKCNPLTKRATFNFMISEQKVLVSHLLFKKLQNKKYASFLEILSEPVASNESAKNVMDNFKFQLQVVMQLMLKYFNEVVNKLNAFSAQLLLQLLLKSSALITPEQQVFIKYCMEEIVGCIKNDFLFLDNAQSIDPLIIDFLFNRLHLFPFKKNIHFDAHKIPQKFLIDSRCFTFIKHVVVANKDIVFCKPANIVAKASFDSDKGDNFLFCLIFYAQEILQLPLKYNIYFFKENILFNLQQCLAQPSSTLLRDCFGREILNKKLDVFKGMVFRSINYASRMYDVEPLKYVENMLEYGMFDRAVKLLLSVMFERIIIEYDALGHVEQYKTNMLYFSNLPPLVVCRNNDFEINRSYYLPCRLSALYNQQEKDDFLSNLHLLTSIGRVNNKSANLVVNYLINSRYVINCSPSMNSYLLPIYLLCIKEQYISESISIALLREKIINFFVLNANIDYAAQLQKLCVDLNIDDMDVLQVYLSNSDNMLPIEILEVVVDFLQVVVCIQSADNYGMQKIYPKTSGEFLYQYQTKKYEAKNIYLYSIDSQYYLLTSDRKWRTELTNTDVSKLNLKM